MMKKIAALALPLFLAIGNLIAQESVLSNGDWYHFTTQADAVYKLTYEQLSDLGILNEPVPASSLSIFSNGPGMLPEANWEPRPDDLQEVAITVTDGGDGFFGSGDYLLFYGADQTTWAYAADENRFYHTSHLYDEEVHFFLTTNGGQALRIQESEGDGLPVTLETDQYIRIQLHETNTHNFHGSGKHWYGESFEENISQDYSFAFPGLVPGTPAQCFVDLVSRSYGTGNYNAFTISTAGTSSTFDVVNISNNYLNDVVRAADHALAFTASVDPISVNITMDPFDQYSGAWLNYLVVQATCTIEKNSGEPLHFRSVSALGESAATRYFVHNTNPGDLVWDITHFQQPELKTGASENGTFAFEADHTVLREFVCFSPDDCPTPNYVGPVFNQNLKGQPFTEAFIVTHPDFLAQAAQLALFHIANDGMSVNIATTSQIYNEFSGGTKDITAIKDYLRHFYSQAGEEQPQPLYLCIIGDGSYDPLGHLYPNSDFVPTFQSESSFALITSYCSDDYFGLLGPEDSNELQSTVKLGIGRIPATTAEEAQTMVNKIIAYNTPESDGAWQRDVLFVADDEDNNLHMSQSNALANAMAQQNCNLNTQKVFFDNFEQVNTGSGDRYPGAQALILDRLSDGVLICNYTGHSGFSNWSSELVMVDTLFAQLENAPHLPLFFMANCEFSKFDSPVHVSGSEIMLFNPNGGAIACVSNARPGYSSSNYAFNTSFYANIFDTQNGTYPRLGDLMRFAKNSTISSSGMTHRSTNLLGDPMMRLNMPELDISIEQISGAPLNQGAYVMPFNANLELTGYVTQFDGSLATDFNGSLEYIILDSPVPSITLGNDNFIPFEFNARLDTVAMGNTAVINGAFNADVFVSGNGNGYSGTGKLLLFAADGERSATGCFTEFSVAQSPVGLSEAELLRAKVYPNPVASVLSVELDKPQSNIEWDLFGPNGKHIVTRQTQKTDFFEVNLSGLAPGMYTLRIAADQMQPATLRVVKTLE